MTTTIPIKQVYKELKDITQKVQQGASFLVIKNSQPVFRIVPIDGELPQKKYTMQDILCMQFKGGADLSQNIDNILYS
jgi:antitoxin (DNA-binding transcriptional repressor) of toxin-antitoxin stability system